MAQPTNLYDKYDLKGDREDLINKIYLVDPVEVPVTSAIGRTTASNTYHEWQRDSLAAANKDNALIDGDDFTADALTPTERVGNYSQIFGKKPAVSRRANIVKKAGRGSEMVYKKAQAMKEIKRDIEAMVLSNNPAVAGNSTTASKSAGMGVQFYANTSHGGAGATASWTSGAPTTAVTAGTNRTFTEALLKAVVQSAYTASGAVPSMVVMSPNHKELFSAFAGIAASRVNTSPKGNGQAKIVAGADIYASNFGQLEIVPHYIMVGATDVFLINTEYAELAFLDGFREEAMGKTGDSDKLLITADVALAVRAPKAMAKIANLTA